MDMTYATLETFVSHCARIGSFSQKMAQANLKTKYVPYSPRENFYLFTATVPSFSDPFTPQAENLFARYILYEWQCD